MASCTIGLHLNLIVTDVRILSLAARIPAFLNEFVLVFSLVSSILSQTTLVALTEYIEVAVQPSFPCSTLEQYESVN